MAKADSINDERSVEHSAGTMTIVPETQTEIEAASSEERSESQMLAVQALLDMYG